jgi:hypothetical protein
MRHRKGRALRRRYGRASGPFDRFGRPIRSGSLVRAVGTSGPWYEVVDIDRGGRVTGRDRLGGIRTSRASEWTTKQSFS